MVPKVFLIVLYFLSGFEASSNLKHLIRNEKIKETSNYIFPCYYYYEPQNLKPESIPANNLCTHIIIIGCFNDYLNTSQSEHSSVLKKVSDLKNQNPHLKVIISMATNSDAMHFVVKSQDSMLNYVNTAIRVAIEFNYDGIDFDWEYPCNEDKFKFTQLLSLFRGLIAKQNLELTLSAAIGAGIGTIQNCFDLDGLSTYLDYINVMCYDYNSIYNTKTAYASPLYARPEESGFDATLNTNYTIHYLIENNVPKSKIVVGLNAGGHTYQLADPNKNGFHAPVLGVGYGDGWSLYPQLCELFQSPNGHGVYDEEAEVLYAYYEDQWANTGDVRSATAKANWAMKMELAGVFTWCLNWDDIYNVCGHGVDFPIHRAIRHVLFSN